MSGSKKDIVINRTIFERRKSSIYICTRAKKKSHSIQTERNTQAEKNKMMVA